MKTTENSQGTAVWNLARGLARVCRLPNMIRLYLISCMSAEQEVPLPGNKLDIWTCCFWQEVVIDKLGRNCADRAASSFSHYLRSRYHSVASPLAGSPGDPPWWFKPTNKINWTNWGCNGKRINVILCLRNSCQEWCRNWPTEPIWLNVSRGKSLGDFPCKRLRAYVGGLLGWVISSMLSNHPLRQWNTERRVQQ